MERKDTEETEKKKKKSDKNQYEVFLEIVEQTKEDVKNFNLKGRQDELEAEFENMEFSANLAKEIKNDLKQSNAMIEKIESSVLNLSESSMEHAQDNKEKMKRTKENKEKMKNLKEQKRMDEFNEMYKKNEKILSKTLKDSKKSSREILKNCIECQGLQEDISKKLEPPNFIRKLEDTKQASSAINIFSRSEKKGKKGHHRTDSGVEKKIHPRPLKKENTFKLDRQYSKEKNLGGSGSLTERKSSSRQDLFRTTSSSASQPKIQLDLSKVSRTSTVNNKNKNKNKDLIFSVREESSEK
jgi:hypothetical protein